MKKRKIAADSSANRNQLNAVPFASAPLKIVTADREFVDDRSLDVEEMIDYFGAYRGKSKTSCPSPDDWLTAFADAEEVFCVTITSGLSGSYNAACVARDMYMEAHPDRRVLIIDSLSAGPEPTMLVEKLEELILEEKSFEEISAYMREYRKKTGLLFSLESLKNFAANGRVSPTIAKIAGVLGIRVVGKASDAGTLEPCDKCRGEGKALAAIMKHLKANGLKNGRVLIAHSRNEKAANTLKSMIAEALPNVTIDIERNLGLCSYYAEQGGVLVGYEKF